MQGDPLGWTWRSVKLTSVYQNMAISEERLRLSNIGATAAINLADGPRPMQGLGHASAAAAAVVAQMGNMNL